MVFPDKQATFQGMDAMMAAEVVELVPFPAKRARSRIGPLLAAFAIIVAANVGIRVWRYLDQREQRQEYARLSEAFRLQQARVSGLEQQLLELETEMEGARRLLESLDGEISATTGNERIQALSRRSSAVKSDNLMVDDYRKLYRIYENESASLKSRRESLDNLADNLDVKEESP